MKITKTASGKTQIKLSRKDWEAIGKQAGWIKKTAMVEAGKVYVSTARDARPAGSGVNVVISLGSYESGPVPLTNFFSEGEVKEIAAELGQQLNTKIAANKKLTKESILQHPIPDSVDYVIRDFYNKKSDDPSLGLGNEQAREKINAIINNGKTIEDRETGRIEIVFEIEDPELLNHLKQEFPEASGIEATEIGSGKNNFRISGNQLIVNW